MGMEPVQPGAVLHFEAHPLARARLDRSETCAVGRFRQRQAVEMDGSGLRQRVFEHRVEGFAAAREEDRLRDSPRPEVCHVPATPGNGIGTFDDETSHVLDRGSAPGAERIARCWVQKVSNLILNINIEVRNAATDETVYVKSVDIRGNTDETWLRGVRRLVDNIEERRHHLR